MSRKFSRTVWLCGFCAWLGAGLPAPAFEPGNIRYEFPCKVGLTDQPACANADFDDQAWPDLKIFLSRAYQLEHLVPPGGILWNRIRLTVDPALKGQDLVIAIEDGQVLDAVYFNGKELQPCWRMRGLQFPMRRVAFAIPADLIRFGAANLLALRYYNYSQPREDTLGRVELRAAAPDDRAQINGRRTPWVTAGAPAVAFEVASGLPRAQEVRVAWRVEDYFGAILDAGTNTVALKPVGMPGYHTKISVPLKSDGRAHKGVAWVEGAGWRGPETWDYVGRWPDVQTEFRRTIRLVDGWSFAMAPGVTNLTPAHLPADPEWKPVKMPHELWNTQPAHRMWYRHQLAVPADMAGQRIALFFFDAGHQIEVFVDGQPAGARASWELPGEFDLTRLVTPGGTNVLLLGVTDYVVGLKPELLSKVVDGADLIAGRSIIAPVSVLSPGNRHHGVGCVPELRATPAACRLDWVGVASRVDMVRGVKRLKVMARVANPAADATKKLRLQCDVRLRGQLVRALPAADLTAAPAGVTALEFEADFPEGAGWTLNSPVLYQLTARLMDGAAPVDAVDVRFGFRQFEARGRMITMNGAPLRAMGGDFWAPNTSPRGVETLDMCRLLPTRDGSFTHAMGAGYLDILDEAGGLAFADNLECMANTRNIYAAEDPRLYVNVVEKFRNLIPALHHHPSIMIWDWGNEVPYYVRKTISDDGVKLACRAVAEIQALDPSRFSTASALGDGRGHSTMSLLPTHSGVIGPGGIPNAFWYFAGAEKTPAHLRALFARDAAGWSWLSEEDKTRPRYWPGDKPLYHSELHYWGYAGQVETGDQLFCALPVTRKFVPNPWGGNAGFWVGPGAWFANESARGDFYRLTQTWLRGLYGANHVATRAAEEQLARAVVFPKYWENKFCAGEQVDYPIFAVNNYLWPEPVKMAWALYAEDGEKLAGGERSWELAGGELAEDVLKLAMPVVDQAVYLRLVYTVTSRTLGREYGGWERLTVFPRPDLPTRAAGLTVALYDPAGHTAPVLRQAGMECDQLAAIADADLERYQLLLIGENGVDDAVLNARGKIRAAVEKGLTCTVLLQDFGKFKDIFPATVTERGGYGALTYLVTPRHPLAQGLLPEDFNYWRNPDHDHLTRVNGVGFGATANVRIVAENCLAEIPTGAGRYIVCQMPLARDLAVEPAAQMILGNLLANARPPAARPASRALTALDADREFVESWARRVGVAVQPLDQAEPARSLLLATGASLIAADAAQIKTFVEQGGTVWVNGVASNAIPWLAENLNLKVRLTPNPKGYTILARRDPLLDGIPNAKLTWGGKYGGAGGAQQNATSNNLGQIEINMESADCRPLLAPSYLAAGPVGRGLVVLDNLRWPHVSFANAQYCFAQLAYNLGLHDMRESGKVERGKTDYSGAYEFFPLDIAPRVNRGFKDESDGDGQGGWSDQGADNDMRHLPVGTNLVCLGVPLRIVDPAKNSGNGCIALAGGAGGELPREVTDIKVGMKADMLFFFHSAAWGPRDDCFVYRIWYDDRKTWIPDGTVLSKAGPEIDVPVRAGSEIADWWKARAMVNGEYALPNAELAWAGSNGMAMVGFYVQVWKNPRPEKTIETIDIISTGKQGQYFILGITAGKNK